MEKKNESETIKEIIKELISKMGFSCEVEDLKTGEAEEETKTFNLKTTDSNFLIGQYGINLQSLQHIARILVRKKTATKINFLLDINSYRREKNDSLVKFTRSIAEQAIREKRAVVLRPMSAYERRIVHMELSNNNQVKTESIGEGEERKVVVSPLNLF